MATGQTNAVALVDFYRARIEAYDQSGPKAVRGPLHGIPVIVKDNFETPDASTTAEPLGPAWSERSSCNTPTRSRADYNFGGHRKRHRRRPSNTERSFHMLIVAVVFEFVPGGFDRVKDAVKEAVENSRTEAGAQIYDWAIDVTAPNRAIIFEVWDDQAALDEHFTHPYMDRLVAALSEASIRGDITHYSADIYDVSGKRDMGFTLPTA